MSSENWHPEPIQIDLHRLKVLPLGERKSLTRLEDILVSPESNPEPLSSFNSELLQRCAGDIRKAREAGAGVMLIYGAHLLRNGAALILERLMRQGWITHLATNGAGSIHDWEYAWLGQSTENVQENVAGGIFGTWDETGRNIHLALLAGGIRNEGYGTALGRFIMEDGVEFPPMEQLLAGVQNFPSDPLAPALAELLASMERHGIEPGPHRIEHRYKHGSIIGQAFNLGIPLTVHPGIGYDIVSNHPMFNGAAIGRAADRDFRSFCRSVHSLDQGVVLSVGSAIMGPQVFEKSLSAVNNLRLQANWPVVQDHNIYVVDLQEGGQWDWSKGEPPKDNPAYYLRFLKSFSRMGGRMEYLCCDNLQFVHHLHRQLCSGQAQ